MPSGVSTSQKAVFRDTLMIIFYMGKDNMIFWKPSCRHQNLMKMFCFTIVTLLAVLGFSAYYNRSIDNGNNLSPMTNQVEYRELYNTSLLGMNWAYGGINLPISSDFLAQLPDFPNDLPIFISNTTNKLLLACPQDYLNKFNLSIENHSCSQLKKEWYQVQPLLFVNDTERITLYGHGAFIIDYNLSASLMENVNITEDEAYLLAQKFLLSHGGIPSNVSHIKIAQSDKSFFIRYIQDVQGMPILYSAEQNQILITIDKAKWAIDMVSYHWPELLKIGEFDEAEIADPGDVVSLFIMNHNANMDDNLSMVKISLISYEWSPTIGYTYTQNANGSPYYIYLPYIKVEWNRGITYLSPLKSEG